MFDHEEAVPIAGIVQRVKPTTDPGAFVLGVVLLIVTVASLIGMQLWRADGVARARVYSRAVWPLPDSFLDAFARAGLVMQVAMIAFFVGGSIELFAKVYLPGTNWVTLGRQCAYALDALAFLGLVLVCSIVLFNRPRSLVARGLCEEPGLILVSVRAIARLFGRR